MKQQLYSIKDEVTGWNAPIIIQANDEEAKRTFVESCQDERSMLYKYAKDYSCWWIGERDTIDGQLTEGEPRLVIRGESIARREEQ